MDSTAPAGIRYSRALPYWAVLTTDFRQTVSSWVYRLWVLMSVAGAAGYLLYNVGVQREAGLATAASLQSERLLRGLAVGGLGLVALLSVSSISGERGSVADAVLSRGISRHQYFLAKWHARLLAVLLTFALLSAVILAAHTTLLDGDLTLKGATAAVILVCLVLAAVVSWGVTVGALASGTVIGITLFWVVIYGGLAAASLLPEPFPTPQSLLGHLHLILSGQAKPDSLATEALVAIGLTAIAAAVGLVGFGRKDV